MMQRDYYEVLSVSRTAGEDEIKRAYRKMAMKYHPDHNPGDDEAEQRFKEAAEAYDVLSNPDKRARYDQFGHAGMSGAAGGGGGFGGGSHCACASSCACACACACAGGGRAGCSAKNLYGVGLDETLSEKL